MRQVERSMKPQAIVIGSLNIDLVTRVPCFPRPGETVSASDVEMIPGGKGANQAAAASRLGARVGMVGRVGQDAFGDVLLKSLGDSGVAVDHVGRDANVRTGMALITVDGAGQNAIVVVPGANAHLGTADVDAAEAWFETARLAILQLEIPLETVEHALEVASHHHLTTILNAAPARDLPPSLLAKIDVLVVNETECTHLSGLRVRGPRDAREAADRLLARGPRSVVVTLGDRGALLVDGHGAVGFEAPAVTVVDTTAAGDAFVGGFAVQLLEGSGPRQALLYGICAGSLAVTKMGAQSSLPSASEVRALLSSVVLRPLSVD